jgi:phosphohistidine phosphatase
VDLLIVRHAIAFSPNPRRWPEDRERPLTPEGVVRARRAAKGLGRIVDPPERVLTSPLARAVETAAILTACAGWPEASLCAALAPGVSPETLLEVLLEALRAEPCRRVAIVGHQPGLGRLMAHCLAGAARPDAFQLKKPGAALLAFTGAVRAGGATLCWLLPPGVLRAVR